MTDKKNRDERLQIMLTGEELSALDDWRFARRMPSRAAAVRELLRRGLTAEGVVINEGRTRSKDFGVTDAASSPDPSPIGRQDASQTAFGPGESGFGRNGRDGSGEGAPN